MRPSIRLYSDADNENYLAGLITGDGHLEKKKHRIVIASSDRKYIDMIAEMLKFLGYKISIFYDKSATVWKISIYSNKLHSKLITEYNIPAGNKSCTMQAPNVQKNQITNFLSGLYDAEGWPEIMNMKYIRIRIKMKNKDVSNFIYRSLKEKGFKTTIHEKDDGSFVVNVGKRESAKRFLDEFTLLHPKWVSAYDFF